MEKREIAMRLLDQDILEYEFQFRLNNNWYRASYYKETGFEGNYPNEIADSIDYLLLDCKEEDFRNIIIK